MSLKILSRTGIFLFDVSRNISIINSKISSAVISILAAISREYPVDSEEGESEGTVDEWFINESRGGTNANFQARELGVPPRERRKNTGPSPLSYVYLSSRVFASTLWSRRNARLLRLVGSCHLTPRTLEGDRCGNGATASVDRSRLVNHHRQRRLSAGVASATLLRLAR